MIGALLGPYRIEAELAAGAMGVVYRARDTRLDRAVALKVLTGDPDGAPSRVLREARVASRFSHPNICTVHDVGDVGGTAFIVMELIEGQTLSSAIPVTGLPPASALACALQVAGALAHAHAHDVVHRDLKAANVMMTPGGQAKVCDFGLAESVRTHPDASTVAPSSLARSAVGTPAYMAPEVLRGEPATPRADVWAFGVLLQEICTGARPFKGATTFELASAIMTDPPASMPSSAPRLLTAVVVRCLQKDPARRYRDGGEITAALQMIAAESPSGQDDSETSRVRAIAVLPFNDLTRDAADACVGLGLADAIITDLALVRALVVRPTSSISSYEGRQVDVVEAGRALGVDAVVGGSFQRSGARLRVTVQLVNVADGRSMWSTKVTVSVADLFQMQDDVARAIVGALEVRLTKADEGRLANVARPAASDEAMVAYLEGRFELVRETLDSVNRAIELFERSIALDPAFALAHAGLAAAYVRLAFTFIPEGDYYARAEAINRRALELDPALPESRYVRGRLLWCPAGGFDHDAAIREFLAAAAGRPNLNEAHHYLGIVLFHLGMSAESEFHLRQALRIDQNDSMASIHLSTSRYYTGDFRGALDLCLKIGPQESTLWLMYQTALCHVQLGDLAEAERIADQAVRRHPTPVLMSPIRGLIAAGRGDAGEAHRQIDVTVRNRRAYGHYHHAQYEIACIYAQLGNTDAGLEWLQAAAGNGFPCAEFFDRDPLLESLRSDFRYAAMTAGLRAECARYGDTYRRHC